MSKSKTTSNQYVDLIGYDGKKIVNLSNIVCFRKPIDANSTKKIMSKYKYALGMVSAHNIYRKPNTPYCTGWCHCFKEPEKYLGEKPKILLSESDFMDPQQIVVLPKRESDCDFFYFTIGGELGDEYKGVKNFVNSLPVLCGKYKLKGTIIIYAKQKQPFPLNVDEQCIWNQYKCNLTRVKKLLNSQEIASVMSKCKFGFFPNKKDCSPLMLTECLVRNCPVLVNEDILGGWKYADGNMGELFNLNNIDEKVNTILNKQYSCSEYYMQQYGYNNTAIRLGEFLSTYYPVSVKMAAFNGTQNLMRKYS